MRIAYTTEEPGPALAKAIRGAATRDTLLAALTPFARVADDAIKCVEAMTDADFREFRRGLAREQRGTFAGEEWTLKHGAVVLPEVMISVTLVAQRFGAPWGCAFIRMAEAGLIEERDGRTRMTEKWRLRLVSPAPAGEGTP